MHILYRIGHHFNFCLIFLTPIESSRPGLSIGGGQDQYLAWYWSTETLTGTNRKVSSRDFHRHRLQLLGININEITDGLNRYTKNKCNNLIAFIGHFRRCGVTFYDIITFVVSAGNHKTQKLPPECLCVMTFLVSLWPKICHFLSVSLG